MKRMLARERLRGIFSAMNNNNKNAMFLALMRTKLLHRHSPNEQRQSVIL
jgi:hypothetical protein